MITKIEYYWHVHHDKLIEQLTEPIKNRIEYIKNHKPKNEIETRLRLLKNATGIKSAWKKYEEILQSAWKKYKETKQQALEKYEETKQQAWKKSGLEKLHKQQCGCKEWNGKELVFARVDTSGEVNGKKTIGK